MAPVSNKGFLEIQANYRVWIHSEPPTWHANNIQYVISRDYDFIFHAKLRCDFVLNSHFRSSQQRFSARNGVLRNFAKFTGKTPVPESCNFIKKKTLTQVFSCEFCEISMNTFLQNISGRLLLAFVYTTEYSLFLKCTQNKYKLCNANT